MNTCTSNTHVPLCALLRSPVQRTCGRAPARLTALCEKFSKSLRPTLAASVGKNRSKLAMLLRPSPDSSAWRHCAKSRKQPGAHCPDGVRDE